MKEYYKVDIPDGYRIFEKEFEIAGIHHRKKDFIKVMKKGALVEFRLSAEPNNPKDKNAIQVRGKRKGLFGQIDKTIGYLPASISSYVADSGLLSKIKIRPKRLYIGKGGYVEFIADILGPKELYEKYKNV